MRRRRLDGTVIRRDHARRAYDALGDAYRLLISGADHEAWCAVLERLALDAGLGGRRLLDVACGSGESFRPFLARGYVVTACDISPRMVALAADPRAQVVVEDMRSLPVLGSHDLALCLNDAANYLTEPGELEAALRGIARNLAPGGVLVFDVNSVRTLRDTFGGLFAWPEDDRVVVWRGAPASRDAGVGDLVRAEAEVLTRGDGGWERAVSVHVQRHHPEPVVRRALAAAGLQLVKLGGMPPGVEVRDRFDELEDLKALYVARRPR
jgi:SAM-dependent methyltransferase